MPLEPNSLSHEKLKLNDWYRLTFVVLGMFLLLSAIADLFYWASFSFYIEQSVIPVELVEVIFNKDNPNKAYVNSWLNLFIWELVIIIVSISAIFSFYNA